MWQCQTYLRAGIIIEWDLEIGDRLRKMFGQSVLILEGPRAIALESVEILVIIQPGLTVERTALEDLEHGLVNVYGMAKGSGVND